MRRRTIGRGLALAGIATLALAVTASAEPGGNGKGKAKGHDKVKVAKQCAKEKKRLGKDAFRELYGKPAMKNCKALGDDGVGAHEGKTFDEFYGTNGNKKNAFGKCVSMKAKEKEQEQPTATR